ncbi:hypothetical protein [Dactylosporangium sp. NPDC000521]|uniref:hypothetical protein n=1 Tax=Dactylosporangium sp. NPDC000521 TaxID=3363975 RepID=UPI00367EBDF4
MAFAVPASGEQRARPSTVNLAVYLLYAAAGIELINTILSLVYAGALADGMEKANAGIPNQNAGIGAGTSSAVSAIFGILIIVVLVLLAVFIGKGKQIARILTWVFGGIVACCSLGGFAFTLAGETLWEQARKQEPNRPTWDRYNELLYSEVPGWFQPVTTVLGILLILAILAVIVLLALPASHPYFRKVEPQWEPPVPGAGGDPGYPGGYPPPADGPPHQPPPADGPPHQPPPAP